MTQLWQVTASTFEVEEAERLQEALAPLRLHSKDGIYLFDVDFDDEAAALHASVLLEAKSPEQAREQATQWLETVAADAGVTIEAGAAEPEMADFEDEATFVLVRVEQRAVAAGLTLDEIAERASLDEETKKELFAPALISVTTLLRVADALDVWPAELLDPGALEGAFKSGVMTEQTQAEQRNDPRYPQQQLKEKLLRKRAAAQSPA
ncbi:MAG: hypothetical protein MSC30_11860 [Gaiellaceae bacterium MAG52_C11]|nr:hypothetical protein [Candidatus Gaiellasilicea maunaloa]